MSKVFIYSSKDSLHRGGGRYLRSLSGVIENAELIDDLSRLDLNDTLIVPFWKPTEKPIVNKRYCQRQILCLLDVIPLVYPSYFPLGLKGKWNVWRNGRLLVLFDKIVTISQHSKNEIMRVLGVAAEKIEVIYPTLDPIFIDKKVGSISDIDLPFKDYFIYVGDANWNKNLINLAQAIQKSNANLVVVGKVFEKLKSLKSAQELREYMKSLDHIEQKPLRDFSQITFGDKRFFFTGYMNDDELKVLYQGAIANILVSFDEGFGYSYFEAASRGCPSILSDIEIFRETAGKEAAFFTNPNEITSMMNVVFEAMRDDNLRFTIAKNASTRYTKILDSNEIKRRWKNLLG